MGNPKWLSKTPATEFYESLAYDCPKCHTRLRLEGDPKIVLASDIMFDRCPDCDTYIVINMLEGTSVIIEGYPDSDQMHARSKELTES